MDETDFRYQGHAGSIFGRRWAGGRADYVVLLVHGYGEHSGRYGHVAKRLVDDGAVVYAADLVGHGKSDGERVLIVDFEPVIADIHLLEVRARSEHPDLPVVLVGHSMGAMIGARYVQRWGADLACTVLSGLVIGSWGALDALLAPAEIPDVPIDPSTLSRDPAVGEAYVADPLVWHGPFKRPTILAIQHTIDAIAASGKVETPLLWLHGEDDQLVPMRGSTVGWASFAGRHSSAKSYPEARHEIFNETNQHEVLGDVIAFIHENLPAQPGD